MHVKSVHEGMKPFQCVSCDAKFVQEAELDKQRRILDCMQVQYGDVGHARILVCFPLVLSTKIG